MPNFAGAWKVSQATVRPNIGTGGLITPKPFPYGSAASIMRLKSCMVTAAAGNAGTIYVAFNFGTYGASATHNQTRSTATKRERTMLKIAAGQSFTFSGMNFGGPADRSICFGSGFSYIHASATPNNLAVCTWLEPI